MKPYAVQFGAGNIGRGFLGQLFAESGLEVVFVDVDREVIAALNRDHRYIISIVGLHADNVPVKGVRGLYAQDRDAVAQAVAGAQVVSTAAGANALRAVAEPLAAGLLLRHKQSGGPLNVLLCENLHDAGSVLKDAVRSHLPEGEANDILAETGFVQAVVSRMVPLRTPEERAADPTGIRVEAYKRLPIDAAAMVPGMPKICGVEPVTNFTAQVERKLYTHNCAHAVLGYMGAMRDIVYGWEALQDPAIFALLNAILDETGKALVGKHHFLQSEQRAHTRDLLRRFENRELGDTCLRLARDPLRKLAPDDRLVGAARLCEEQGTNSVALCRVIAAALTHVNPDDPSSVKLKQKMETDGLNKVLVDVCGIRHDEPLGLSICNYVRWQGR